MDFKIGDVVELAIDKEEFKKNSEAGGSDKQYIEHFYNGHSAVISGFYDSPFKCEHICFRVPGFLFESNWFHYSSFKLVETELSKIQQESQRL